MRVGVTSLRLATGSSPRTTRRSHEDWRNREKWDAYHDAVCEMVDRTSTEVAPWTLIGANNKYHARLVVLRGMVDAIEAAL